MKWNIYNKGTINTCIQMKQFLKLEFTLEFFKLIFLINLNLFGF